MVDALAVAEFLGVATVAVGSVGVASLLIRAAVHVMRELLREVTDFGPGLSSRQVGAIKAKQAAAEGDEAQGSGITVKDKDLWTPEWSSQVAADDQFEAEYRAMWGEEAGAAAENRDPASGPGHWTSVQVNGVTRDVWVEHDADYWDYMANKGEEDRAMALKEIGKGQGF